MAKDFEATINSARAFLYAASVMLLVRRIARASKTLAFAASCAAADDGLRRHIERLFHEENIVVCYEYIDSIWKNAPEKTTPSGIAPIDALIGPFVDVFLHEAGHVVFNALKIPLFGRRKTPPTNSRPKSC